MFVNGSSQQIFMTKIERIKIKMNSREEYVALQDKIGNAKVATINAGIHSARRNPNRSFFFNVYVISPSASNSQPKKINLYKNNGASKLYMRSPFFPPFPAFRGEISSIIPYFFILSIPYLFLCIPETPRSPLRSVRTHPRNRPYTRGRRSPRPVR